MNGDLSESPRHRVDRPGQLTGLVDQAVGTGGLQLFAPTYMALDAAIKHTPDLLILDINMPAGDGFSVIDRLRKRDEVSHTVPLIIVSGESSAERRAEAHTHGAFGYLTKPFESGELVKMVRQALHEERILIPSV